MDYQNLTLGNEKVPYVKMGDGPVLLFLHGFGIPLKFFEKLFNNLSTQFTIIAPEIYGLNIRNNPPITIEECATLTQEFCEKINTQPQYIAGHSLGGGIALEIAKNRSDIKIVILLNPLLPVTFGRVGFMLRGLHKHIRAMTGITGGTNGIKFGFGHFFPFLWNFFKKPIRSFGLIDSIAKFDISGYTQDRPIALICGEKDEYFQIKQHLKSLESRKNITQKLFPKLSHDWPLFYQELAAQEIIDSLSANKK